MTFIFKQNITKEIVAFFDVSQNPQYLRVFKNIRREVVGGGVSALTLSWGGYITAHLLSEAPAQTTSAGCCAVRICIC